MSNWGEFDDLLMCLSNRECSLSTHACFNEHTKQSLLEKVDKGRGVWHRHCHALCCLLLLLSIADRDFIRCCSPVILSVFPLACMIVASLYV